MTQDVPGQRRPAGTSEPRRRELVDLYELLEISPRASQEVIQAAYRVLARSYHPDLNATEQAARRIRELNAAYKVLSDPQDRACYDLEYSRAHRFERLLQAEQSGATLRSSGVGRARALPSRPHVANQRAVEERLTIPHGAAMVGLLVVAIVAAILLVLIATGMDAPADYNSVFDGASMQSAQH